MKKQDDSCVYLGSTLYDRGRSNKQKYGQMTYESRVQFGKMRETSSLK